LTNLSDFVTVTKFFVFNETMKKIHSWRSHKMDIEVRHLQLVATVAEEGSLTKAGNRLHLTQSALSHQLRDIEEKLGALLFRRLNKKMILTQAGERLLHSAQVVRSELESACGEIQRMAKGESGVLRLSTECHTCYHWLPALLKKFNRKFPNVEVRIVVEATHHPVQALLHGKLDLAIMGTKSAPEPRLRYEPLFQDELVVIMPPDHPLRQRRYVEARDFAGENLFVYDLPDKEITVLREVLVPAGVTPKRFSRVQLTEAIIELVKSGLGISVLARWAVRPYLKSGELAAVSLTKKGFYRNWRAVLLKDEPAPDYIMAFIKLLANKSMPAVNTSERAAIRGPLHGWIRKRG
jgi:LysR family transcriptional regulator for metE and metH